jgi:hypothetical protein
MSTREEVLAGYRRPYVRALPHALRSQWLALAVSVTTVLAVAAAGGALAGWEGASVMLALAIVAAITAALGALWGIANGVAVVRRRTEDWHGDGGELSEVRARRPHRFDADAEIAHQEYAVAVSDDGDLITYRFTPLHAHEPVSAGAVVVPGVPRYESRPIERTPYDIHDTARAAEQLAAAQTRAAELELDAARHAREDLELDGAARELMRESRSTADALRGATGQDPR